jgi:RNA polymerase sigma factor (sigma-70 family)
MRSRQSIVDVFSTFLRLEDDRPKGWIADAQLHRSIQGAIADQVSEQQSEPFWALFWHQRWWSEQATKQNSVARSTTLGHLSAYLQEVCYWSARTVKSHASTVRYPVSDFFQVAISELPKILTGCDPTGSASLKTYAYSAFGNIIRDFLRQRRDIDLCNDWGLLLKLSRKRLIEALTAAGLDAKTIEQYVLAWQCFSTLYIPPKSPGLRRTAAPSPEIWKAIVDRYNQLRSKELSEPGEACTASTIERWLTYCTARVRAYLYPAMASLNAPKAGFDSGEWQDDLEDGSRDSLLSEMIAQEERQERLDQYQQMNTILVEAIAALDETTQQLLQLYYQKHLIQQEIAKQLGIQQYTVSRKLTKTRETLLLKVAQWSQETLKTALDSTAIKNISPILDEWLQTYYHDARVL